MARMICGHSVLGSLPGSLYKIPHYKRSSPTMDIIIDKQEVIYNDDVEGTLILTRIETVSGKSYWFNDREEITKEIEELETLFKVNRRDYKINSILKEEV
jgi:hypothetical protein